MATLRGWKICTHQYQTDHLRANPLLLLHLLYSIYLYIIYFSATSPLRFSLFYNVVLRVRQAASIHLSQAREYRFTE
jgi:hypothetical protein